MNKADRAAQFQPFDALKGLQEELRAREERRTRVETLVQLSQKKPDSTINVKIEFGEGEGELSLKKIAERIEANKLKEKVTYKMI